MQTATRRVVRIMTRCQHVSPCCGLLQGVAFQVRPKIFQRKLPPNFPMCCLSLGSQIFCTGEFIVLVTLRGWPLTWHTWLIADPWGRFWLVCVCCGTRDTSWLVNQQPVVCFAPKHKIHSVPKRMGRSSRHSAVDPSTGMYALSSGYRRFSAWPHVSVSLSLFV